MSLAEVDIRPLCPTCEERLVHAKGECRACREYRRRTGHQRPGSVIVANSGERARGVQRGPQSAATCMRRDVEAILEFDGTGIPEYCAACGTVKRWPRGRPIPLCSAHLGNLALLAVILHETDEMRRVLESVTA